MMKNVNVLGFSNSFLKLNIFCAIFILAFSANVFSDDLSTLELFGPAAAEQTAKVLPEEITGNVMSDYDFNQINGTGQITSGDINAIKQIVVAEPNTNVNTTVNNVATPVSGPSAQVFNTNPLANNTSSTTAPVGTTYTAITINTAKVQDTTAPSYALINANTKHIYAVKDQTTKYNPSGLTNLMTAYIATQRLKMDALLKVNRSAVKGVDKDAAIAALDVGDTITLKDAIASMFVKGCVDSANVIAENVSNSIEDFVSLMNVTAAELGLNDTHFVDPSGISNNNESSALDMAIIMAKVCENPELVKLLALYEYVLPATSRRDKLHLYSRNTQLNKDNSTYNADIAASRLAYTSNSKYCIASMMSYYNNNIVAVILKSEGSHFGDTNKLLQFGKIATTEDLAMVQ